MALGGQSERNELDWKQNITDGPPLLCGVLKKVAKSKMEQRLVVEPV
jgi:hypothetical protein